MPCTTVLAGKLATNDRSTMIARTDDGHFDEKKLIVVEPDQQPKIYKSVESHVEITLPENPMRYTSCPSVDPKHGIWAATGINAANVGMTATETTTSNPRVLAADPMVELREAKDGEEERCGGIGEEDIVVLVLPYIHSAREGVLRLGALLEQYGTYESNGIAFNDENEVWWMETIGPRIASSSTRTSLVWTRSTLRTPSVPGNRISARQTSENSSRKTIWI